MTWLEDEYLSEVTIGDIDPTPLAKGAKTVRFTWWLHGTGGPSRVPYHVVARDVSRWTLDGELGTDAIEFEPAKGAGIRIAMNVPGRLVLHCRQLVVERGAAKKRKPTTKKPLSDYSYFHVEGTGAPTPAAIAKALGAPDGARLEGKGDYRQVLVGNAAWAEIYGYPAQKGKYHWNVVRKGATDEEWHRALELPHRLGASSVVSAWEFMGTPAEFLVVVGRDLSASSSH